MDNITRIIIAGGRDFVDLPMLESEVVCFIEDNNMDNSKIEIVSGMAKGADMLGVSFAKKYNYDLIEMPADWSKGKSAGYTRNEEMAKYAASSKNIQGVTTGALIAFWDGFSKGTEHMIKVAKENNLKVHVVKYSVEHDEIVFLKGQYSYLSMFHKGKVKYENEDYDCGEAAFQASKTLDKELRKEFIHLQGYQAKQKGNSIKLRPDWEDIKYKVLLEINYNKFLHNEELKNMLLSTGEITIMEGNFWHDNEYGNCLCQKCKGIEGKNVLGQTLEKVRKMLQEYDKKQIQTSEKVKEDYRFLKTILSYMFEEKIYHIKFDNFYDYSGGERNDLNRTISFMIENMPEYKYSILSKGKYDIHDGVFSAEIYSKDTVIVVNAIGDTSDPVHYEVRSLDLDLPNDNNISTVKKYLKDYKMEVTAISEKIINDLEKELGGN